MSLYGSLFTGVSGLAAQSNAMSMISNNIANVNTVGYKGNVASFSSLVTNGRDTSAYSPGGVLSQAKSTINQQGILQQTASGTDMAVTGAGFFVVSRDGNFTDDLPMYTRAGSFSVDESGFMRNANGFVLMGTAPSATGVFPPTGDVKNLSPVNVAITDNLATPTSKASMVMNLNAGDDITPVAAPQTFNFSRAMTVYDSLGGPHNLQLDFRKTAANQWEVTTGAMTAAGTPAAAPMTIDFDPATGTPTAASSFDLSQIDWGNGSASQDISVDLSKMTQFAAASSVTNVDQNGSELGRRMGISVSDDGYVTANFSNGETQRLYRVDLATFVNPEGLEEKSGNVYIETETSGGNNIRSAGSNGAGVISASALESSNIDLAEEFSRMIVTQRAYSANTKTISTADQMLTELLQLR